MKIHDCVFDVDFTASCGCKLVACSVCGLKKSVFKCEVHKPVQDNTDSRRYYTELLKQADEEGIPYAYRSAGEFEKVLNDDFNIKIDVNCCRDLVLDIGAGLGFNATLFLPRGYAYVALDTNKWACDYIRNNYGVDCLLGSFSDLESFHCERIISSHALEHFKDAEASIKKMFSILKNKGIIYLLVPEGTDILNPDHNCFFTEENLKHLVQKAGFKNVQVATKSIIAYERYIYLYGEKHE